MLLFCLFSETKTNNENKQTIENKRQKQKSKKKQKKVNCLQLLLTTGARVKLCRYIGSTGSWRVY